MAFSLAANTVISTLGRVLGSLVSLVTLSYMVGYLGAAGFGIYSTALAFVYIFNYLADLGLYSIVVRDISKPGADARALVSSAFTLRLIALIIFLGAAPAIALLTPYSAEVKSAILIMTLFYAFSSLAQLLMGVFQRHLRTDKAAIADVFGRVVQLGLVLAFIQLNAGILGMAWALSLSAAAAFVLTFYFARKFVPFGLSFNFKRALSVLKDSWPIGLAIIFTVIYFKLDTIILAIYHPAHDVGIYNMGYRVLEALIFFPAMFAGLIMPLLSRHGAPAAAAFKKVLQSALNVFIVFTLPLGVFLVARAPDIIALIDRQNEFLASAGVLRILAFALFAIYFGALFSNALIALHRQRTLMWIYFWGAVFNVALNLIFVPLYSYMGAAWTTVATEVVVTALMIVAIVRLYKLALSWVRFLPVGAASAVFALMLGLTLEWNFFLAAALSGSLALGALLLFGGFNKTDLDFIRQNKIS